MTRRLLLLSAALCVLAPALARAAEAPVVPALGDPFSGELVGADAAGKLRFMAAGGATRDIPLGDLALWGALVEPGRGIQIIPSGGGLIVADGVRIEKDQLRGESQVFGALSLPLELVAGIVFRPRVDLAALDQLRSRMAAPGGQRDRVLLDNGDELTGTVLGLDNENKPDKSLRLQTDAGKTDVGADRIAAIIFNPSLVERSRPSGLRTLVGFRDGSQVVAVQLAADKTNARFKLAGGAELRSPTDAIGALQVSGGRAVYLSDLKPSGYRHIPYLQLAWPYQADRSVLGSQLRAGGKLYAKGLGMHSPARISYDLGGAFRRFQADVAIDQESGQQGSVVFRAFTDDGSGAWQERYTSPIVRGGDAPVPISVDVSGAKRLSLLVDYADRGDELDHADWLNARLVR